MPESRNVGQTVIIAQIPITQQFLPVLVGSGHGAQSAFELHELGHEPPSDPLPPDELPSPEVLPPDEPTALPLISLPGPVEELSDPDALFTAAELPVFAVGGYPYGVGGVLP